jgi:transposase
MSNKRITEMYIKQIIRQYKEGKSQRQISKQLGIHRRTITEYIGCYQRAGNPSIEDLDDQKLLEILQIEAKIPVHSTRYEMASKYIDSQYSNRKKVGFTIENLYQDYISSENECHYSRPQFYRIVNEKWNKEQGSLKLDHKYGEKLFVDYTGKNLKYYDKSTGEEQQAEVMVCILPASGYIYVKAVVSQQVIPFIEGIKSCLEYLGGVPRGIITDNLKSAVTRVGKYESTINKQLQSFADHYGTSIDPTRAYSPKDKAMVEGAVKICYSKVFYHVQDKAYQNLAQVNEAIKQWTDALNKGNLSHCDYSRYDQFEDELKELYELPSYAYRIISYQRAKVQKMGYVLCSKLKNYYSVPYTHIGKRVELQYDQENLWVYYNNERIATHKLSQRKGHYVTNSNHLSSANKAVAEWNPEYFIKQASQQGKDVERYVSELIAQKPYPEQAYKQIQGILNLCRKYDRDRVNRACEIAFSHNSRSYKMIEQIIVNEKDLNVEPQEYSFHAIGQHDNIRGSKYFI